MHSPDLLQLQFRAAHETLEGIMADVTPAIADWTPPGKPARIGAQYLHVLLSEDIFIHTLTQTPPLLETEFAGRVGTPEIPGSFDWEAWGHSVSVNLDETRAYAQAVYAFTDQYLRSLKPDQVSTVVDLSVFELGQLPVGAAVSVMLENCYVHAGEIACLKGLQGRRGYVV